MPLSVHIVTAEREVFAEEGVEEVVAPGSEGELTVLPQHAPLLTMIKPGIMRIVKGGKEADLAITGGFLEVRDDRVTILADAAERTEEIDEARAEEARGRAERSLEDRTSREHMIEAQAALQRALLRIKAVERRRTRREGRRTPPPQGS
jgi:F-type H+-transporting ATPase subunit epsilon